MWPCGSFPELSGNIGSCPPIFETLVLRCPWKLPSALVGHLWIASSYVRGEDRFPRKPWFSISPFASWFSMSYFVLFIFLTSLNHTAKYIFAPKEKLQDAKCRYVWVRLYCSFLQTSIVLHSQYFLTASPKPGRQRLVLQFETEAIHRRSPPEG